MPGRFTQWLRLSTPIGRLPAGILAGPRTPGFIAGASLATPMAEIGDILPMFGVGRRFHPRKWRLIAHAQYYGADRAMRRARDAPAM